MNNILIFGASGAIGKALVHHCLEQYPTAKIIAVTRAEVEKIDSVEYHIVDFFDEDALATLSTLLSEHGKFDLIINAIGILHDNQVQPEKSLKEVTAEKLRYVFNINTVIPALLFKHFSILLSKESSSIFAMLSARVGSIADNKLGGWYSYRASKAALNMIIKNTSIEIGRFNKKAIIVGIHPGTVNSNLSSPFQNHVPEHKLFQPDFAATKINEVLQNLTAVSSGKCFAWDAEEVQP